MVDSYLTLTTSVLMIILFTVAIFGFAIGFASDNSANMSITDDPQVSALNTGMKANLSKFKNDSTQTYRSILDTTIEPGSDVAQSNGPFAISFWNIIDASKNIVYLPYQKIFGSGSGFGFFFTTFIAFLLFIGAFLLYKAGRGNP